MAGFSQENPKNRQNRPFPMVTARNTLSVPEGQENQGFVTAVISDRRWDDQSNYGSDVVAVGNTR